jgi:hypothetical protein
VQCFRKTRYHAWDFAALSLTLACNADGLLGRRRSAFTNGQGLFKKP